MTVTSAPPTALPDGGNFVLDGVSWDYYERTLREAQERHLHLRITYDRGRMEFTTNSARHEVVRSIIGRFIEVYALEKDISVLPVGSVTCRREDLERGLEPDECYYVTSRLTRIDEGMLDLNTEPPPDLAVEVDITRSSIPRQPIYAALGVKEVWRFDGQRVIALHRQSDGAYRPADRSLAFPDLPMHEFNQFLGRALAEPEKSQHAAVRAFQIWARQLKP